jgi:transposase
VSSGDARSLSGSAQAALRERAVRAVLGGMTQVEAGRVFGVHPNVVGRWVKRHRAGGWEALRERRRGRRRGEQLALEPWQQGVIARLIAEKNPEQLRLEGFLWTREAVRELIHRRFGVKLAVRTVGNYLRSWGMSPQKPQRRAFEQNPEAVRRWLTEEFPKIKARAKREGGVVLWLDEMGVRSDHAAGTSWAPVGKTPTVRRTGKRFAVNMISAISNTGALRFRLFQDRFNAALFLDFLGRLIRHERRKIHLILDGHPVHRAKVVRRWIEAHADEIELHFLPGYSPQLNPVELLNHDVKQNAAGRKAARTLTELVAQLRSYLHRRQNQPWLIARFFDHPDTRYAAA